MGVYIPPHLRNNNLKKEKELEQQLEKQKEDFPTLKTLLQAAI